PAVSSLTAGNRPRKAKRHARLVAPGVGTGAGQVPRLAVPVDVIHGAAGGSGMVARANPLDVDGARRGDRAAGGDRRRVAVDGAADRQIYGIGADLGRLGFVKRGRDGVGTGPRAVGDGQRAWIVGARDVDALAGQTGPGEK